MNYDFIKDLSFDELKELKEIIEDKTGELSIDNLKSDSKFLDLLNIRRSIANLNKSKFVIDNVELTLYFNGLNSVTFVVGNVPKIKNIPQVKSVIDKYEELNNQAELITKELAMIYSISVLEIEGLVFKENLNR